jgi:hypothetical protein
MERAFYIFGIMFFVFGAKMLEGINKSLRKIAERLDTEGEKNE